jgi:hypothetical protein
MDVCCWQAIRSTQEYSRTGIASGWNIVSLSSESEGERYTDREAMDLTSEQIGSRHTTETEQRSTSGAWASPHQNAMHISAPKHEYNDSMNVWYKTPVHLSFRDYMTHWSTCTWPFFLDFGRQLFGISLSTSYLQYLSQGRQQTKHIWGMFFFFAWSIETKNGLSPSNPTCKSIM